MLRLVGPVDDLQQGEDGEIKLTAVPISLDHFVEVMEECTVLAETDAGATSLFLVRGHNGEVFLMCSNPHGAKQVFLRRKTESNANSNRLNARIGQR